MTLWRIAEDWLRRAVGRSAGSGSEAVSDGGVRDRTSDGVGGPEGPGMLRSLRVAAIMDEFTWRSFEPECDLLQLTPTGWRDELAAHRPELLLVESAWRGKDDLWTGKVHRPGAELDGILAWCREARVPTVFWNKEDPVHFDTFLGTARRFDRVFTTDVDRIPAYREALGHDRIHLLPFACQPAHTHPLETLPRKDAFCFAGAWYERFTERSRDLRGLLAALAARKPVVIYDRNHGRDDPLYRFPDDLRPLVVGHLPYGEIDRAYKGYRYAITMNTVKHSPSMCARRVFELLASNTLTLGNFSHAVRTLFGDLVIGSDDAGEVVRRLDAVERDETTSRAFRLAGLRKVMERHTYEDRLAEVVSKVRGAPRPDLLPPVAVVARAVDRDEARALRAAFERQRYARKRLLLVVADGVEEGAGGDAAVRVLRERDAEETACPGCFEPGELVAGIVAADHHGPNYLLDLALATRYARARAVGKACRFRRFDDGAVRLVDGAARYVSVERLAARRALVQAEAIPSGSLAAWARGLPDTSIDGVGLVAVDEFGYCEEGAPAARDGSLAAVDGLLPGVDEGIDAAALLAHADRIAGEPLPAADRPGITGADLAALFAPRRGGRLVAEVVGGAWRIDSTFAAGETRWWQAATDVEPARLGFDERARCCLEAEGDLAPGLVVTFLDDARQPLGRVAGDAGHEIDLPVPAGTARVRLGLRLTGPGASTIRGLRIGRPVRPVAPPLLRREHLLIARQYPSYGDLYRFGFVHTRVAGYAARGRPVDVFRLRDGVPASFAEYRGVDVATGSPVHLARLLETGRHRGLLVHFLDEPMWDLIRRHAPSTPIHVWVHGVEIQPWWRRDFNYDTDAERAAAREASDARVAFWRRLLAEAPDDLRLVFVSRSFAEEVMEDLGVRIPEDRYTVIHNPIDTELFAYRPKPAEQRKRILSIGSYATRTYANDLAVRAVLDLATRPWFGELEFRFVGDGRLFDEVLAPLRGMPNVAIERRFLAPHEIRDMHREHGVFLRPSRCDSQGVSRDEAMASGLVPVTNAVGAIPEFVDAECGFLAAPEDAAGLAAGIEALVLDADRFAAMSASAARRVRRQSAIDDVLACEMALFAGPSPGGTARGT